VKRVWTTLRHSITTIVHNEPLVLRNVVGYTGGRLVGLSVATSSTVSTEYLPVLDGLWYLLW
jgi:hypothetical protein